MSDHKQAAEQSPPDPKRLMRPSLTAESPEANAGVTLPSAVPEKFRDMEVAAFLDAAAASGKWFVGVCLSDGGKIHSHRKTNSFPPEDVPVAIALLMRGQSEKIGGATTVEKTLRQAELYNGTIERLDGDLSKIKATLSEVDGTCTVRPWGKWTTLHQDDKLELRLLEIEPGGFCSTHLHQKKFNCFEVVSGRLFVTILRIDVNGDKDDLSVDHVIEIGPGNGAYSVPPDVIHFFHTDRATTVYETMRSVEGEEYDPEDTVTFREAGKKEEQS